MVQVWTVGALGTVVRGRSANLAVRTYKVKL